MGAYPEPQGVLTPLTDAAVFLVVTVRPGGEQTVAGLIPDLTSLLRAVGFRLPEGHLSLVTGFGSAVWGRLFSGARPAELHEFVELRGTRHHAPATLGDLLFHIRADRMDLCFELAAQIMDRLDGMVDVCDEVHGFRYFDRRDLFGFVDGTENPPGRAAIEAAIITDADPAFAGGSYAIVQKYVHDLDAWNALTTEAQSLVIGRHKLSNVELPDDRKPADSHVALNTVVRPDGMQQQIVRDNMPFGKAGSGEFGTYFIGYCHTPSTTEEMLRNMFLGQGAVRHDRILDFSTAVTGCLFYVPPIDFLDDPPPLPDMETATAPEPQVTDHRAEGDNGTLRIGDLKGVR
ncbi:Dyp-type peroxidase [Nonomuraea longicatena]|uniref:Dyp-type peroxidase n=2 Tax=Nonomuraea longicatena TaxID=83682 RepID=A0ABP4ACZ1_9ACTN